MGFRLQQKSLASNDLELLCCQCYAYCDKMSKARITGFRNKVALYLSYLHIKFEDEIKMKSLRFSSIISH